MLTKIFTLAATLATSTALAGSCPHFAGTYTFDLNDPDGNCTFHLMAINTLTDKRASTRILLESSQPQTPYHNCQVEMDKLEFLGTCTNDQANYTTPTVATGHASAQGFVLDTPERHMVMTRTKPSA